MTNWVIYNKQKNIEEISEEFGINRLTSVILCNRNILDRNDIKKILSNNINDINEAELLPDVDIASNIIAKAIDKNKSIRIVGDYDIDGVCSTYILYDALKKIGANISYDIPDRILDGYGISFSIIDRAINDKVDLIITCDNGIAAGEQIKYATEHNIDVIVTDHHDINELPNAAVAIVNPKRTDVSVQYPYREICGAVVAWKLIIRLYELYGTKFNCNCNKEFAIDNYVEFAMLATIGDIMPLVNENHIIAKIGLNKILKTKNKGLRKLLDICGVDFENKGITAYHIGFIIGPLINAAGRMDKATLSLELLITEDGKTRNEIAEKLKLLNDERKNMTEEGTKIAIEKIEKDCSEDKILVLYIEGIGEQVAGIIAGRVKEKYNKPTIILTDTNEEETAKASCRSIEAYDIFNALSLHKDMFIKFGGHKLAAGFSIKKENIEKLKNCLNSETVLTEKDFIKKIYIDAEFLVEKISEQIIQDIEKLEPYGRNFQKPVFATKGVKATLTNVYGAEKNVLKLLIEHNGKCKKGVAFLDSTEFVAKNSKKTLIDILYFPKINEYMGNRTVEINIVDYH